MTLIDDIIELKKECKNTFGETYAQLYRHYKNLWLDGRLEVIMNNGKVTAFMGWVRQPHLSFPLRDPDYNSLTGKYLYVINAVVKKGNIWDLIKSVRKKNKYAEYVVFDKEGCRHTYKLKG